MANTQAFPFQRYIKHELVRFKSFPIKHFNLHRNASESVSALKPVGSSIGLAASRAGFIGFVSMAAATAVAHQQQQTPAMQEEAAIVIRAPNDGWKIWRLKA